MQIFKCCCAILVYPLYIVVCKRKDNKFFFFIQNYAKELEISVYEKCFLLKMGCSKHNPAYFCVLSV